jgi:hypothetical protein
MVFFFSDILYLLRYFLSVICYTYREKYQQNIVDNFFLCGALISYEIHQ